MVFQVEITPTATAQIEKAYQGQPGSRANTGDQNQTNNTDKLKEVLEIPQANLFLFRPSNRLLLTLDQFDIRLDDFYPQGQLWRGKK